MGFQVAVVATFVLGGALSTFFVSRIFRVELSIGRFLGSVLASTALGFAVASIIDWALLRSSCTSGEPCGYPGSNEGGGIIGAMILLICYSITYMVAAVVIARFHSRRPIHTVEVTPNKSLERTREG
jgi:hypothetical protein